MILTEQKQEWNILIDSTSLAAFSSFDTSPLETSANSKNSTTIGDRGMNGTDSNESVASDNARRES